MVFLRSADGKIKARISNTLFGEVLRVQAGHWQPHDNPNPDQFNNAYVIDRDLVLQFIEIQLFIIASDYFVPGKV